MKTAKKSLENCQVEIKVELDAAEIVGIIKDVEKAFMREAQLPGFRKGKIPLQIIRKEFANGLKQEIERAMFQKKYAEAAKAEGVEPISLSDVKDISYTNDGGAFTAIVEVRPEFKLPTYKGLKVEFKDAKVEDSTVSEQVERLRAAYAKFEDAKEGEMVSQGDYVQFDYTGMVGKKSILEINPEAKIVGEGKGFWTQVDEGRFLPEILDALKGMKIGETKSDIKVKFDKASAPEGLKGEKAAYTITLKAFRHQILPTDAEFAERAKAESYEKLVADTRATLEKRVIEQESIRRENEAIELLMKKVNFEVPQSQVRRAMDGYLQELAQRAQYSGLGAEYFEKNRDKIMKDAEETATKQVRLWYVLDAIAKEEKIEAKDEERGKKVMEFILANAKK